MATNSVVRVAGRVLQHLLKSTGTPRTTQRPRRTPASRTSNAPEAASREPGGDVVEVDPRSVHGVLIDYAPERDGAADAGEIVWAWVPYAERDGRGKDRPLLVVARADRAEVFAVKLTSKAHAGDSDYVSIGAGSWDAEGRESWVDLDQLYRMPETALRREAASLDRARFDRVADELVARFGWRRR